MKSAPGTTEKTTSSLQPLMNYNLMADLFMYPEHEDYKKKVKALHAYLLNEHTESAEALKNFVEFTEASSIVEIQELFLRSFDIQAITTLDIGFILFGEDYKRGKLLVHLNEEHNKAGNTCETELSDHLPNLLRLIYKMPDEIMRNEIATLLVLPAVVKMISEFSVEKIEKKDEVYKKHQKVILDYSQNYRTAYQSCLQALFLVLKKDFGYECTPEAENKTNAQADPNHHENTSIKDFSLNIETEMLTEK
ncbi:MAG: hypothetical protein OJF59_002300 [Cytophagales bacterium]|jgi:nitrate reductase assembly molybdenum cofactor insertion protein NarJ|nr:hypothetical protein [Bacteroidota bacterium]MBS1981518.1 hypothetical protein [Bacteroidota bacterium]WHZ08546.1 MAG: hypothetical protein OJF59_002300 [Cytophagales bacterium]